jgi:hypothetical protein
VGSCARACMRARARVCDRPLAHGVGKGGGGRADGRTEEGYWSTQGGRADGRTEEGYWSTQGGRADGRTGAAREAVACLAARSHHSHASIECSTPCETQRCRRQVYERD